MKYDSLGIKVNTPTVMINAGYQINPYFALEGRFGFGVGDDSISGGATAFVPGFGRVSGSGTVTVEIDNYFGGFVRVGYPAHQRFYPYAMLGYGQSKFTVGVSANTNVGSGSGSASGDDEDFAYGIGANIGFSDSFFGKVEYMNYYDENIQTATGFTLGLEAKF